MGTTCTLTASDSHSLGAYRADPDGSAKGVVVVLQEIFSVNAHIRDDCDRFVQDGYAAIAPALYDRSSHKHAELTYTKEDVFLGRKLRGEVSWDDTVLDVKAAVTVLGDEGLKVGTVGYCWGGSFSYLSATRLDIHAAVVYYGGQIMPYANETARCPLLMHFGAKDASIPSSDIEATPKDHPDAEVHVYDAGHGFNCDRLGAFDEAASKLAKERTLDFFGKLLA